MSQKSFSASSVTFAKYRCFRPRFTVSQMLFAFAICCVILVALLSHFEKTGRSGERAKFLEQLDDAEFIIVAFSHPFNRTTGIPELDIEGFILEKGPYLSEFVSKIREELSFYPNADRLAHVCPWMRVVPVGSNQRHDLLTAQGIKTPFFEERSGSRDIETYHRLRAIAGNGSKLDKLVFDGVSVLEIPSDGPSFHFRVD